MSPTGGVCVGFYSSPCEVLKSGGGLISWQQRGIGRGPQQERQFPQTKTAGRRVERQSRGGRESKNSELGIMEHEAAARNLWPQFGIRLCPGRRARRVLIWQKCFAWLVFLWRRFSLSSPPSPSPLRPPLWSASPFFVVHKWNICHLTGSIYLGSQP